MNIYAAVRWTLFIAAGYFSGGIMFSRILPRILRRVDITAESDDGNPGAANAVKHAGWRIGMLCLLLDLAKAYLPVAAAVMFMDSGMWCFALMMLAPVLGHATSPFEKRGIETGEYVKNSPLDRKVRRIFAGGKAIAASFGVMLALLPQNCSVLILAVLYIFFSTLIKIRPNRVRSIVTFFLFAIIAGGYSAFIGMFAAAGGIAAVSGVVMLKHTRIFCRAGADKEPAAAPVYGEEPSEAHI